MISSETPCVFEWHICGHPRSLGARNSVASENDRLFLLVPIADGGQEQSNGRYELRAVLVTELMAIQKCVGHLNELSFDFSTCNLTCDL